MSFSTPAYIFLFLPVVVLVYFLVNRRWSRFRGGTLWLTLASICFYSFSAYQYLPILIFSIGVNFFLGVSLGKAFSEGKRKGLLGAGIVFNLGLLGYFKYTNFFLENLNALSGAGYSLLKGGLPLAISFYTFQQIAYLVDCYQGKAREHNLLDYCFFIMFFPQMIAGPIVRHRELMPHFQKVRTAPVNWSNCATGLFVFGIGVFKKVIIADSFAVWADAGFGVQAVPGFFEAWVTSLSYTFQLYFDFSGYTDMAIGSALLFNIRLPINFNSPYKAVSIQDFWQRWHITLSRWLRDYLYIPLGGNRRGTPRALLNVFITFLLGGIWHGAGWTFVVWGALHGLALAVLRLWRLTGLRLPRFVAWLCTFLFINVTWVFFRAGSLADAGRILKAMLPHNIHTPALIGQVRQLNDSMEPALFWALDGPVLTMAHSLLFIAVFPLVVFLMPNSMQLVRFVEYEGRLVFRTNLAMALLLSVLLFISWMTFVGDVTTSTFLYFNF